MEAASSLERIRALWHDETSPATRRACWAVLGLAIVTATLVGRSGTASSRAGAALALVLGAAPLVLRALVLRRRRRDARVLMEATLVRTEPGLGQAALRALDLSDRTAADPARGSHELAKVHFSRLLGRASLGALTSRAGRAAWRATAFALVLAAGTFALVVRDPFRVVEGLDVLGARHGVAPVAVGWVDDPRVAAEPPSYLDHGRTSLRPYYPASLAVGTSLTVHADPLRVGRRLVLTDGQSEVPFLEDGEGAVVARWTVDTDAALYVAARFGEVLVYEPEGIDIHAIPDEAPYVKLEGAPVTKRLLDSPKIPVHWEATDDHGLREVVLVMRAGEREARKQLSKPQGGVAVDRGGIELRADDPFLKKSYVPVEVTVEALDNDPIGGPKWGRSQPILVVPPEIGEREAMRYAALLAAREAMTDVLAARLDGPKPTEAGRRAWFDGEKARQAEAVAAMRAVMEGSFGGLRVPGRLTALVRGQIELLDAALAKTRTGSFDEGKKALVERTESTLLALDSALGALGFRDTRTSALKLSEVAADAAQAIAQSREPADRIRATRRLQADLQALTGGGGHLLELGGLGLDLGEIVSNGLRRIHRAWEEGDRFHAKLAAEDLAARLRQPDPSFGSSGGGGPGGSPGQGGVEAGGAPQPSEGGDPSNAAEQAAGVEQALEELRQEHAAQMEEVERMLRDATTPEAREALEEQLREMAKEVREAVKNLPDQAADPSAAAQAAGQAKSQAESMAGALERGDLPQAVEQGKNAIDSLQKAQEAGEAAPDFSGDREIGQEAGQAKQKLEEALKKSRQALDGLERGASERARPELERAGQRERELGEKARGIGQKSADSEAPLPRDMLERLDEAAQQMEEAAGKLQGGDGRGGHEKQEDAQRLLEMAQPEEEQEAEGQKQHGDGQDFARDAEVPPEARDRRADDFRKRVTDGLGKKAPPHLRDALRRYTEGLLR